MKLNRLASLVMVLAAVAVGCGGCQRSLFNDSDSYTQSRLDRYYLGDSATKARAERSRSNEMGFGFPTGMANQ